MPRASSSSSSFSSTAAVPPLPSSNSRAADDNDNDNDAAAAAVAHAPPLQLLPSTSFVPSRQRKPAARQPQSFDYDAPFHLQDPAPGVFAHEHPLAAPPPSSGQALRQRNHSFDSATPTPTALSFAAAASSTKAHHQYNSASVDSPRRPAFDPSLQPSAVSSELDYFPQQYHQEDTHSTQFSSHHHHPHSRAASSHSSILSSARNSTSSAYPQSYPATAYEHGTHPLPPPPPIPSDEAEALDTWEGNTGEPAMPPLSSPSLKVDTQPTEPANPPNLPKRSASLKKSAPKRAQSTKKSFWNWGSSNKDEEPEEPMEPAPAPLSPRAPLSPLSPGPRSADVTPISTEPQSTGRAAAPSPGYYGDDNYYASDDGYTSRSASPVSFPVPSGPADTNVLVKELEDISAELASSIRREMELEDEIDRYRTEMPTGASDHNRRTSDYYSDSGASSARFPPPDVDLKLEGLEKMRRKAEQEKAQLRVEMAQKVQEDLNQRRALEMHIQSLEEQLKAAGAGAGKEIEAQLEDLKRRLNDEKQFKENFEDLLAGMREEIESFKTERDNLRDEVVPKLSSENQNLVYENTRMQQEVQNLKNENQTLQSARKLQMHSSIKSIAEEGSASPEGGLSRSNSLSRSKSVRARSGSAAGDPEGLPERLKNAEDQRDALQRTLKSLIMRQTMMTRHHTRQIVSLQTERDRALSGAPRRAGFAVEVHTLRNEVNKLRQRADEALEQKFQCEKGLTGLKMDLERAQQETTSLRDLLQENDISVPDSPTLSRTTTDQGDALEHAFAELRRAHADSIAAGSQSPTTAEATAGRMTDLTRQVQDQKASNQELRERLTEAVNRGEKEQTKSERKINELQSALRAAEERLMQAQGLSEDVIAHHEDHVRDIKDAASDHAKRGMKTPAKGMSSGGSPTQSNVFDRTRLAKTSSGKGVSAADASQIRGLQRRVRELEDAAGQAEEEMQGVVERMNAAQIEVADLQMQRDEAQQQTRKLRKTIEEERARLG